MNKRLFVILIISMTVSLLGIVFVQGYWIHNAFKTKEEQFTLNVRRALISASRTIQLKETEYWYNILNVLADSISKPDNISLSELIYTIQGENKTETFIFQDGILEESYKIDSDFINITTDSIEFKRITNSKNLTRILKNIDETQRHTQSVEEVFDRLRDYELKQFEDAFAYVAARMPIHQRISLREIQDVVKAELAKTQIRTAFEFAVFDDNLATSVRTDNFEIHPDNTYKVALFPNEMVKTNYELYVNFPKKDRIVLGSMGGMLMLTILFTAIILIIYASALSQIFRQRQLAEIKTDFINNMTHELKTPISTINLALDALNNPKVRAREDFMQKYLDMLREENHRMLEQVENVLRISQLDKRELDLPKEKVDVHELIQTAISHVELLATDRGGYIKTHFNAEQTGVLVNLSHMTNVFVNLLDNAIKYSEDEPKVDVYTENTKEHIIIKIKDQGIGLDKQSQHKIFDKFYRQPHGNIHNVKGHGLGLAYVHEIVARHDAQIQVESTKGKGSTFILKFHLIS